MSQPPRDEMSTGSRSKRRDRPDRGASAIPGGDSLEALHPRFFARPAEIVARDLLGQALVSTVGGTTCIARIVETEAYTGPEDDASHAAARIGLTTRNAAMFGPPGKAYVYRIYGVHWCLNAVTGPEGHPSAVLIRAAEPIEGLDIAQERRPGRPERELMRGPGNLCLALGVDGTLNHHSLQDSPLILAAGQQIEDRWVCRGPRVGVTRAVDLPLRFWLRGSPWVSRGA
jgi:DNA-3-methyladenine glycosylase